MNMFRMLTISASMMLLAAQAQAVPITNNFGLSAPDQTLTFSEVAVAANAPVTTQFAGFGVTFSGGWDMDTGVFPNISGPALNNFPPGNSPIFIEFALPQSAVAFAMVTNAGTSTFSALLGGVGGTVVESFSAPTELFNPINFFGFSNILFDTIRLEPGGFNNALLIDNLQTI